MDPASPRLVQLSEQDRQWLTQVLQDFSERWSEELLVDWVRQLPANPALRQIGLQELVKIDLRNRWQNSSSVLLDGYLMEFPELGTLDGLPVDLILAEYQVRQAHGDNPQLAEYAKRFPQSYAQLEQQINPPKPKATITTAPVPSESKAKPAESKPISSGAKPLAERSRPAYAGPRNFLWIMLGACGPLLLVAGIVYTFFMAGRGASPATVAGQASLMDTTILAVGGILVGLVAVQLWLVTVSSVRDLVQGQKQYELTSDLLRQRIEVINAQRTRQEQAALWNGYRKFVVQRKELEAEGICSFYLEPHDRKPLPYFKPGQYLTFRVPIPGHEKPVIRCYSLSDSSQPDCYRITIKRVPAPPNQPEAPAGLISNFFHEHIHENAILDVGAPRGHFVLDPLDTQPVVLIAGGVGITPMMCMLNAIAQANSKREAWLFYGVRNGREHAWAEYLSKLAEENQNFFVVNCYSHPTDEDIVGRLYQLGTLESEVVSVSLMKRYLQSNNYKFYMCGPPGMMKAITEQLEGWGVPKDDILTEKFVSATTKKAPAAPIVDAPDGGPKIKFHKAGKEVSWNPSVGNLLDLALSHGVEIDSGCRAGNCGTCQVALRDGKVKYPPGQQPDVEEHSCLTCIAVPDGPVILDA